jgi:hypothetical protein
MEFPGFKNEIIHAQQIRKVLDTLVEGYFINFPDVTDRQKNLIVKMVLLDDAQRLQIEDQARRAFDKAQIGEDRG